MIHSKLIAAIGIGILLTCGSVHAGDKEDSDKKRGSSQHYEKKGDHQMNKQSDHKMNKQSGQGSEYGSIQKSGGDSHGMDDTRDHSNTSPQNNY